MVGALGCSVHSLMVNQGLTLPIPGSPYLYLSSLGYPKYVMGPVPMGWMVHHTEHWDTGRPSRVSSLTRWEALAWAQPLTSTLLTRTEWARNHIFACGEIPLMPHTVYAWLLGSRNSPQSSYRARRGWREGVGGANPVPVLTALMKYSGRSGAQAPGTPGEHLLFGWDVYYGGSRARHCPYPSVTLGL